MMSRVRYTLIILRKSLMFNIRTNFVKKLTDYSTQVVYTVMLNFCSNYLMVNKRNFPKLLT